MQSEKGSTRLITFRKIETSRHHSQSNIPSKQQAGDRDQHLKKFHMRKTHMKRKSLEGVCRQNYRLYLNINKQKSSYHQLFSARCSKKQKKSSERYQQAFKQLPQNNHPFSIKQELKKAVRLVELLKGKQNGEKCKRWHISRSMRTNSTNFSFNKNAHRLHSKDKQQLSSGIPQ